MIPAPQSQPAFDFGKAAPIRITHPDRAAFLDALSARMTEGRGFAVATINLDHVVKLHRDPAFAHAYAAHDHIVADGHPIVWLCRMAGWRVDLVPGSELIEPLCARAAALGVPVAMVGAREETLAAAAKALEVRHPNLDVVLRHAPPMGFDPDGPGAEDVARALRASGAGLCFIALGAPKQERLAARLRGDVTDCGLVSIGAGLDFLAGSQVRAPAWVRRLALEWVWRLARDPRRMAGRYAACAVAMPGLAVAAYQARRGAGGT